MHETFPLLDALPLAILIAVAAILSVSGLMSGLSGFGFSAIGATCLFLLPPTLCIPLLFALSSVSQVMAFATLFGEMLPLKCQWRNGPVPFMLGGLAGAPLGVWMLAAMPARVLLLALGAFLVLYAAYSLRKPAKFMAEAPRGLPIRIAVGAVGGVIGGFTAFPGSAIVVWLGLTDTPKQQTRRAAQPYILFMQLVSLAVLLATRPATFSPLFWTLFLAMLPLVLLSSYTGLRLYRRISDFNFRRVVFFLLATSGIGMLLKGMVAA